MARITCTECGQQSGTWRHTEYDGEGHGTAHLCDRCYHASIQHPDHTPDAA